jgi:3-O-methylgallate 3,4-dioxygenase
VPVIVNANVPPNSPTPARLLALGHAIGRAIGNWSGAARVALIASGGLSHFVIDEEIDRRVIAAMERGDESALAAIPENLFQAGTGEIKNWLPVVGAMREAGRAFHLVDYVPCYRSEAGTGTAMGFAYWE